MYATETTYTQTTSLYRVRVQLQYRTRVYAHVIHIRNKRKKPDGGGVFYFGGFRNGAARVMTAVQEALARDLEPLLIMYTTSLLLNYRPPLTCSPTFGPSENAYRVPTITACAPQRAISTLNVRPRRKPYAVSARVLTRARDGIIIIENCSSVRNLEIKRKVFIFRYSWAGTYRDPPGYREYSCGPSLAFCIIRRVPCKSPAYKWWVPEKIICNSLYSNDSLFFFFLYLFPVSN